MKLTTGLENFKGVVSDDLSFASVEIDKNYWLTLPRWRNLCHTLSRDQPQPGSFFQRPREGKKRDPGSEVGRRDWLHRVNWPFLPQNLVAGNTIWSLRLVPRIQTGLKLWD